MEGIINMVSRLVMIKPKEKSDAVYVREDLLSRIAETRKRLVALRCAFEWETNFDLIDAYIMEIDGLEKQYSYLLKQAKQQRIAAF